MGSLVTTLGARPPYPNGTRERTRVPLHQYAPSPRTSVRGVWDFQGGVCQKGRLSFNHGFNQNSPPSPNVRYCPIMLHHNPYQQRVQPIDPPWLTAIGGPHAGNVPTSGPGQTTTCGGWQHQPCPLPAQPSPYEEETSAWSRASPARRAGGGRQQWRRLKARGVEPTPRAHWESLRVSGSRAKFWESRPQSPYVEVLA